MKGILRKIYRKVLLTFANWSVRKYNTKIIVLYGWEFSEPLRECLYTLLEAEENTRRNRKPIDWDLGLALFVLGISYQSDSSRFRLLANLFKSVYVLLKPAKLKSNLLIVSLHAKSYDTLRFWLELEGINKFILLRTREQITDYKQELIEEIIPKDIIAPIEIPSSEPSLEKSLRKILSGINQDVLVDMGFDYTQEEVDLAVLKANWEQDFFLKVVERIESETNHEA